MQAIELELGSFFTIQKKVREEDASLNYGSGQLDKLLATPSLVALVIEGATEAIDPKLPEGIISVGTRMEFEHSHATVVGATVSIEGKLIDFDGKKVVISFTAYDEIGEIGSGFHERRFVNKEAMMVRAHERSIAI